MATELEKLKNLILQIGVDPHVSNLGQTKLWKLIYFIDSTALRELGHTITGSDFIRYDHGPVPSRGEKALKQLSRYGDISIIQEQFPTHRINRVVAVTPPADNIFSKPELLLIARVCRAHGSQTAGYLSELSHREPAWHYAGKLEKLSPELMLYGAAEDSEDL